jgi:alkanesulfonate monooxygenase SsuD/methylene tetrahydromethanopterin reductase-like flavin-dependent oxidoreductase (luciferase family)
VVKRGTHFNALGNEIRPVPSPPPPIWIGGNSPRALERAARHGGGWSPFLTHLDRDDFEGDQGSINSITQLGRMIARLRERREELGKSPDITIAVATRSIPKDNTASEAERYGAIVEQLREVGVSWIFDILPAPSRGAYLDSLAWFGENVMAKFKGK